MLLLGSIICSQTHDSRFCSLFHAVLLFTGLDDVLSRLEQGEQRPSHAVPRLGDTTDTSGDESDAGEPRQRLRSKKTYKMKRAWGTGDVGQFFVTGPTDEATKPSHFYCRICRKDVSVLTHGHHEILRHFQGGKHFPRDQRLRLDSPGWEVLDYEVNAMSPAEVERQRERIMNREYPFSKDVIVDETGAVDPNLGVMANVSSLIEVLRLCGSYELVYRLWAQFTLSAIRVNVDATWSGDEVLVSSYKLLTYVLRGPCALSYLPFQSIILNGMYPRILSRCLTWAKSHGSCSVELEEEGDKVRVFLLTWDADSFRRVCVAALDRYSSDPHQEVTALGRVVDALGSDVAVASIIGGSTVLVEAFREYLGSGYRQKLIDYPVFDLRFFRRCLQRSSSSVFGSLDGLAMTEFIVNRLKGAETRDWMSSRPALGRAILTNDLSMPHLVDVVANIIGVWPLIVSYLKETGRKDDGDRLVVRSSFLYSCWCPFRTRPTYAALCFRRRELTGTSTWTRWLA